LVSRLASTMYYSAELLDELPTPLAILARRAIGGELYDLIYSPVVDCYERGAGCDQVALLLPGVLERIGAFSKALVLSLGATGMSCPRAPVVARFAETLTILVRELGELARRLGINAPRDVMGYRLGPAYSEIPVVVNDVCTGGGQ